MNTTIRAWAHRFFIDGLTGMAHGLFATLIIGTIMVQIGKLLPEPVSGFLILIGSIASVLTGLGIGIGVAHKLSASTYVIVGTGVAGMVGAHAGKVMTPGVVDGLSFHIAGPGEPLGAFIASFVAVEIGVLVSGKTPIDILVTPFVTVISGSIIGLLVGPGISAFMTELGAIINWGTQRQPLLMGIIVAVIMGICLTLPISSAALGIILGLSGIAAGAATVGCAAQMVGFAVASYRDNGFSGLIAQGLGTSMLQMPNILRRPQIWLPAIIASAFLGPISTVVLALENNAAGSGMGTSGLVGPLMMWNTMGPSSNPVTLFILIAVMLFLAPALLSWLISEGMRKAGWIKPGDMKLPE
ncbi:PTS transporter subunit IIC [Boudabousia marimammalium]|uniref:PTS sugar transporter subunit IIC n=1 Tax=Boudabousia marimammalium TaxID=156892 RepID=A0A1Q5PQQ7_9ACTO|nr:PTS sugar transporter subunit IIC [Boudabousia marimammalium]OKL49897.1 PTS sugar transporter subunit IIC [Boudabousia marimammalium]